MKMWTKYLCSVMLLNTLMGYAAQLTGIKSEQVANKATLYFTIEGSFTHKIFTLTHPERVVIDLSGTHSGMNLQRMIATNALIKKMRSSTLPSHSLRLVFEVTNKVTVRSSPWLLNGVVKGMRIDFLSQQRPFMDTRKATYSQKNTLQSTTPSSNPRHKINNINSAVKTDKQRPPLTFSKRPTKTLHQVVVVLDAGHGGKDSGAEGPAHHEEKNVVLAITLKLKQLIDRQPGMRAVLTRSGDYYVGLRQRLAIARKYNGDIFVAIHADAYNNPHSNGASVFALSQSGATSEAARWLAEKENYSELGGVNLSDLDDVNGVVRSVLIDLSQTATINASLQMGDRVLKQLSKFTHLHNHRVDQARFVVLKSPDMPSILVETGFISNPIEEKNLTNPAYQARLSQAIFQGIKEYFWNNPPPGSYLEAIVNHKVHVVQRGETWPMIAARYQVPIALIQTNNHLSTKATLKPGQKLVIPSKWA